MWRRAPALRTCQALSSVQPLRFQSQIRRLSSATATTPPPPPPPPASPSASSYYLSFYRYTRIQDPTALRTELLHEWLPRGMRGRVYVATEGINAQMTLPSTEASTFVPHVVRRFELPYTPLVEALQPEEVPFKTLHVRVRPQIVADRLETPLDLTDTGEAVSPAEWHALLMRRKSGSSNDAAQQSHGSNSSSSILIDCRNLYEAELGSFEGATPVPVHTFSQTFKFLDELLSKQPTQPAEQKREALIFCTGGIRCEKVGAYLKQRHGVQVKRLQGGINSYLAHVRDNGLQSLFRGANFVFDRRTAVPVTEPISACHGCGEPAMSVNNCRCCGVLFIHCPTCASKLKGSCSPACASLPDQAKLPYQGYPFRKAFNLP